jgi:hypothetical protein
MSARRILVVTTVPLAGTAVASQVRRRAGDEAAELKIVAPAADVSPLEWLASDEDAARAEAAEIAEESEEAVAGGASVETEVGDPDPVQAIEDALRTFAADEVVVVTPPGEEANWLEKDTGAAARERFGVPVTHLTYEG